MTEALQRDRLRYRKKPPCMMHPYTRSGVCCGTGTPMDSWPLPGCTEARVLLGDTWKKTKCMDTTGSCEHVWYKRNLRVQGTRTHMDVCTGRDMLHPERQAQTLALHQAPPDRQVGPLSTQPDLRGTPTASEGEKPSV